MAQKKVDFFGQFRPTGVDPTVGAKAAALAGLSQQVTDIVFEEGKKQRIKQGREEGLKSVKRDEGGNIIAPEERGSFTFRDQAYNEAMMLAHRAEVRRDTKETLNNLQNQFELDPEAFQLNAEKYREGVLDGMPNELRFVVDNDISDSITQRRTELDDKLFQFGKEKATAAIVDMAEDLSDEIQNLARKGDIEGANKARAERMALMQRGVNQRLIDPTAAKRDAEEMLEKITLHSQVGVLEGIFADDSLGIEEKIHKGTMIVDAKQNEVYKDLDPAQRDSLNKALEAELAGMIRKQAEFTAQEQKQLAQEINTLKLDTKFGKISASEAISKAQDMLRLQQISEGEALSIESAAMSREADEAKRNLSYSRVMKRWVNRRDDIDLTPNEVNDFYINALSPDLEQMEPMMRIATIAEFSKAVGQIPSAVKSQITNNLRTEDVELIKESSALIDELDNMRGMESPVSAHDRAFASMVTELSKTMEPEEAIAKATKLTDPTNKALMELRQKRIKEEKYEKEYNEKSMEVFKGYLDFGKAKGQDDFNESAIASEYKALFESEYIASGDEDIAHAYAQKKIKNNWSYSDSVGRIMKHAPEKYYAINDDASYISEQLNADVLSQTSYGMSIDGFQRAFLVSDEETGKLASTGRPDYLVYVVDADGQIKPLTATDENGDWVYMRWSPDKKAQMEKIKNQNREKSQEARQKDLFDTFVERLQSDPFGGE